MGGLEPWTRARMDSPLPGRQPPLARWTTQCAVGETSLHLPPGTLAKTQDVTPPREANCPQTSHGIQVFRGGEALPKLGPWSAPADPCRCPQWHVSATSGPALTCPARAETCPSQPVGPCPDR